MSSLAAAPLLAVFAGSGAAIWAAGTYLSRTTDALDARLGIGSAVGGLVLLAIATDLPEVAITVSAAIAGNLGLAVGNLLGGIALQTLVLAALDAGLGRRVTLTHQAGSLVLVLEGAIVAAVTVAALMAVQLPTSASVGGVSFGTFGIVVLWVGGLWVVNRARSSIPWKVEAPGANPGRSPRQRHEGTTPHSFGRRSTAAVAGIFGVAAAVTLVAGVLIEESGSVLAGRVGLGGAVFGATILAATTSLPELSTGLAAVRLGDHELAISDIFGGNAFLPVLLVVADAVGGRPALEHADPGALWLAGLGVVLTTVYVGGLIVRPTRTFLRMGPDSLAAVALYALGIVGLIAISR
ncbi:MAG: sodium:calcium antiporter [Thermoleophilaceae bacterium]